MIKYEDALTQKLTGVKASYSDTETMLYAYSIGMGRDPLDKTELPFVFELGEEPLRTVPTMAAVLGRGNITAGLKLDYTLVLHGEQRLTVHRPLPPKADLVSDSRVVEVLDKGAGKGALVYTETVLRIEGESEPDHRHVIETRPDQALIYRLNGDRNPLHADPELAKRAGFPVPILHGLCSYAIACRAVLASVCGNDPTKIASFDVRFTSPVYPGETIETEIWVDGDVVSFRCKVIERGVTSINNGKCLLRRT